MAKRIGKYKVTNRESAISLVDGGTIGGNLSVSGTSTFGGVVTAEEDMNDIPFAFRKSPRRNSLSTGPYVEPSYKARSMYREFAKDKWVGDKKKGFRTF